MVRFGQSHDVVVKAFVNISGMQFEAICFFQSYFTWFNSFPYKIMTNIDESRPCMKHWISFQFLHTEIIIQYFMFATFVAPS